MDIFYEGVNISQEVQVTKGKCRDVSFGRYDSLDMVFDRPQAWHKWNPKPNDRIVVIEKGYSTGTMFVNTIAPSDGVYRILATAAKANAGRKAYASFEGKTLEEIIKTGAAECGMGYRIYGIEGGYRYPYALRKDESWAAFLSRLAKWEGAVLKVYSGKFTMIGILAAQSLPARETVNLMAGQEGVRYQNREAKKLRALTVKTPFTKATARDADVPDGGTKTVYDVPAMDAASAGRFARNLLLAINRGAEMLTLETELHPSWSAMLRVDVTGNTAANGKWIIDEVTHDFIGGTSKAVLLRCIESVET